MRTGKHVAVAGALALLASVAPAEASPRTLVGYARCTEVSAVPLAATLQTAVAVVTFACGHAEVNGRPAGPAAVSEVVAMQRDGSFALLRTATDNDSVQRALARAGLPAVLAREISLTPDPSLTATRLAVRVVLADSTLRIGTVGAPVTGTRTTLTDGEGLQYWYAGARGIVTNTYTNTLSGAEQGPGAGATVVDASDDEQLAGWLGAPRVAAGAFVIKGDWTAEIARER